MGGKAIKNSKKIKQSDVFYILNVVKKILKKVKIDSCELVGSAGKKKPEDLSGDIDVVIDRKELDLIGGFDALVKMIETQDDIDSVVPNKGIGIISCGVVYDGEVYQVDVIPADDIEYSKWMMYSGSWEETPYKSGVRNSIIYWTVSEKHHIVTESDELGELTWKRYIFDHNVGVVELTQTLKGVTKRLKNKKTINRRLADIKQTADGVMRFCYGDVYESSGCLGLTTEQVWTMLRQTKTLTDQQKINIIRNVVDECKFKGFNYPTEFDEV